MALQCKRKSVRRRVPQQINLFGEEPQTIGDTPAWTRLPTEVRAAIMALMTRLILDHADNRRTAAMKRASDDLRQNPT